MPGWYPERRDEPREDDATGWEIDRHSRDPLCACGRAVSILGKCVWCLHGVTPPVTP